MNLEYFIAKRLIRGKEHKISISAPIIKIAITAIAISVFMMLMAIATGVGLKRKIREKVVAFNGHIQIYNYDNNTSDVSVVPVSIEQEFYPEFNSVEDVSHVQAVATKSGIIRTENTFEGFIGKGVGDDYNWDIFKEYLVAGQLPDYSGEVNTQVLVSRFMANRLQLKVGDSFSAFFPKEEDPLKPNQRKFTLVGIYDSGFEEIDSLYVFIDIRHIQRMNKWDTDQVGNFEVFLESFDQLDEKIKEIYGKTVSTLDAQTITNKYYKIFEWIDLFDFNIALIIGIMVIVGGINMITALLVLILERTQMIGILKALGSANWSIRKVFLYNATYLIAIGLFWGNVLGLGLIWVQHKYQVLKFPNPKEYYMDYIPVYIDIPTVLILNIGVLILCMLMLMVPSYIITKISPVKAIKFE